MARNGKKIIIVDDEDGVRNVFSKVLKSEGYDVLAFPSCEHLLGKITANPPDLIILDILLPWESGEIFLKKIKGIKKYAHIPVIVISGKVDKDKDIQKIMDYGAGVFLMKPIDIEELLGSVKKLLE